MIEQFLSDVGVGLTVLAVQTAGQWLKVIWRKQRRGLKRKTPSG